MLPSTESFGAYINCPSPRLISRKREDVCDLSRFLRYPSMGPIAGSCGARSGTLGDLVSSLSHATSQTRMLQNLPRVDDFEYSLHASRTCWSLLVDRSRWCSSCSCKGFSVMEPSTNATLAFWGRMYGLMLSVCKTTRGLSIVKRS